MADWAALLLTLLVVLATAAPFLTAFVLSGQARHPGHLDAELARLLGSPRARGQDSA